MSTWNHEYAGSGLTFLTREAGGVLRNFVDAMDERGAAAALAGYALPAAGATALPVGTGRWAGTRTDAATILAPNFVRRVLADGTTAYSPAGAVGIDSPAWHVSGVGTFTAVAFPAPSGYTRRWRREVYAVANGGTNGQRARFVAMDGVAVWRAAATTDGAFGTTPATPSGEGKYSGKYFDRTGGAWVLSADQSTPADLASEADVATTYPGDGVGGHYADDNRDALNQLVWTCGYNGTGVPGLGSGDVIRPLYAFVGTIAGTGYGGVGLGSTRAAADADYDASVSGPGTGATPRTYKEDVDASDHRVVAVTGSFDVDGSILPAPANPKGQHRDVECWLWPDVVPDYDLPSAGATKEYDAYGSGFAQQQWAYIGTITGTTAVTWTGPASNTIPGTHPSPWPTAAPYAVRGWEAVYDLYLLKWDVASGFAFTAATA